MITEPEKFSEIVREVRKKLDISQEDLAHALGVSFATVNRWENAKTSPSKLARTQFNLFCEDMRKKGQLND
ncbi:MAG: helix-turn-helix transcriptional regulator [Deltaproteobacteria bacterium]|nr:helix-turn-helix transcriptional regulator [Deltaproteobacteria bacterium]